MVRPRPPDQNPLYPLPHDYAELSLDGQRDARRNAVFLQETPEDMVWAWSFFREHYLLSLPPGDWYKPPIFPSPRLHYEYILDLGRYARNVEVFPRAFAKTTLINELLLLWSAAACGPRRGFTVLVIKATDGFAKDVGTKLQFQWEYNERFLQDFGELKPKRSEPGSWSKTQIWLKNGFKLDIRSVMGKLPGYRPSLWITDDAEYDQTKKVSQAELRERFDYMLRNHLIPMLDEGCAGNIVTTLYNRKMKAYQMATGDETEDPSLSFWNRRTVAVKDPETGELSWPEKFPEERLEQLQLELDGRIMGPAYKAQYLNDPGDTVDSDLQLHPDFGYYNVRDPDAEYLSAPLFSNAKLVTRMPAQFDNEDPVPVARPFAKTVGRMYRLMVVDPIRKASVTSDYACAMVVGVERTAEFKDVWWLLDMRYGKPTDLQLMDWIWELGVKWQVRAVGIESIGIQKAIEDRARQMFADRGGSVEWAPKIFGITYKREFSGERGKPYRMGRLAWRFNFNKIKFPAHLMTKPGWRDLRDQIESYTEDLALLPHDDALDTLAMVQFMVQPKATYFPTMDRAPNTVTELMKMGQRKIPRTNIDFLTALNFDELTPEQMEAFTAITEKRYVEDANRKPPQRWGRKSSQPSVRRGRNRRRYGSIT